MDVFKIDQSLNRLGTGPTEASKVTAEVSFDTTSDFGLSFFGPSTPPPATPVIKKEDYDDHSNCVFDPIFSPSPVTPESNSFASDKGEYSNYDTLSGYGNEASSAGSSAANSPQSSASGTPGVHRSSSMPALLPPASSIYDKPGVNAGSTSPGLTPASHKQIKSEPGTTPADSNLSSNSSGTKSFVPCKVCGDKASGYHYGVTSCEGCKGFFRRSIQKQIEYRCLRDGKCLVIRLNRNRCQYCRFKKCLAVGMSRDSVRYGRVPKRNRERNEEIRPSQSEPEASSRDTETKHLALYDVILTISQAHLANCAYTEEKMRGLLRKPLIISYSDGSQENPEAATSTMESMEQQKLLVWEHIASFMTPSIQRIVEFAKRVPGFSELTQDDQLILIKVGFFEIWLAHIACMISTVDNTMTFAEGVYVTRSQLEACFDSDFVSTLFDFAVTFTSLNLNDTEMGLFSAIILLTADRPNLGDQKKIEQQQDKLIEALKVQVERNHLTESHIYPSLIMKLAELRNLGSKHGEHLAWFRIKWQQVKLPPLFAEIFDIPKCEEDLQ